MSIWVKIFSRWRYFKSFKYHDREHVWLHWRRRWIWSRREKCAGVEKIKSDQGGEMPILNYTTKISAEATVTQIERLLQKHGARSVLKDYSSGMVIALAFKVDSPSGEICIRLPINVGAVHAVLRDQYMKRNIARQYSLEEHAYRVAWRILKDWCEAQMAILETQMVTIDQVFFAYVLGPGGKTIHQLVHEQKFLTRGGEIPP